VNPGPGSEIYIGLMSGTSLDGVDIAIVDFAEFPPLLLHTSTANYTESMRQRLRQLCQSQSSSLNELYSLDVELGELFADVVCQALKVTSLDRFRIAALGSHGQTISHSPNGAGAFTAQIGDPARLATRCGITTIADFRRKDIALGGQGAPLAPAFHRFLFHSVNENRVVINIGGISNITSLPADPDAAILGFDTGPGNTLLDYWIEKHRGQPFDDGGEWARSGRVIDSLLREMIAAEGYFSSRAPKSTGTEHFGPAWLAAYLRAQHDARDVQATLLELTARTISDAISGLPAVATNCFVCGGGAHNRFLLERLRHLLPQCGVNTTSTIGFDPDYVEAAAFAWLARERLNLRNGNIPEVTRARRGTILGAIYAAE
jgi:anhydro-N-acetylmuramic acid kinase